MQANRYVAIIDDGLVFKTGKYEVGSHISEGEYYFCLIIALASLYEHIM